MLTGGGLGAKQPGEAVQRKGSYSTVLLPKKGGVSGDHVLGYYYKSPNQDTTVCFALWQVNVFVF